MKHWLISLIRLAIREELSAQLRIMEDKLIRVETCITTAATRVKEKEEAKHPARPRNWSEAKERLESGAQVG